METAVINQEEATEQALCVAPVGFMAAHLSEGSRDLVTGPRPTGNLEDRADDAPPKWPIDEEQMIVAYLPTVRYLARQIHARLPQHVEFEELASAGVLGLIDAVRKFDCTRKVQFNSYAYFRIRGSILDSLRTLDWSPRELRRKGRAVQQAIAFVTALQGSAATDIGIASELHMSLDDYFKLLAELDGLEIGTLHTMRAQDSYEDELAYLPNNLEETPLSHCLRGEMRQHLADALMELPERERKVMMLYYYEELTMKQIATALGVLESRVSRLHASGMLHLRSHLARAAKAPSRNDTQHHHETRLSSVERRPKSKSRPMSHKISGMVGSRTTPFPTACWNFAEV